MDNLIAAIVTFVGLHFAMSHPLRKWMIQTLGEEKNFLRVYALIAAAALVWVGFAYAAAPVGTYYWEVGTTLSAIASVLMLGGSIMLAGCFVGNAAMANPRSQKITLPAPIGAIAITRHPMMWAFACWSAVHAIVAPYPASFVLTTGIAILAIGGSAGQDQKRTSLLVPGWDDWLNETSFVPFAGQISGRIGWAAAWPGRTVVLAGTLFWLLATYLHPVVGGPVVGPWAWLT